MFTTSCKSYDRCVPSFGLRRIATNCVGEAPDSALQFRNFTVMAVSSASSPDGKGTFDFPKFVSVVFRKGGHGHGGRITEAIEAFDRDENGFISADESRRVLTSLIESTGEDEMIPIPPESTEEERPSF